MEVIMLDASTTVARHPRVVFRQLGGETGGVVLHLGTAAYHGVNEMGALVFGLWRLTGPVSYGWDDGTIIHLHRGVPAAPLPSRALRRLEQRLWAGARPADGGWLEPDPESRVAYVVSQAARPGFAYERQRWSARLAAENDAVAPRDRSWQTRMWSAAGWLQREVRPRRLATPLKTVLSQSPLLDRAPARCRFGGVDLVVGSRVFKPRSVTETLLDAVRRDVEGLDAPLVVEVGTGSGAIALGLASARPTAEIHAVDLFPRAVRSARRNRRRIGAAQVHVHRGSLLDPVPQRLSGLVDAVVANVPYVPPERRNTSWDFAPGAIGGSGADGLGLVRDLAA